jgi:hypothetical protein
MTVQAFRESNMVYTNYLSQASRSIGSCSSRGGSSPHASTDVRRSLVNISGQPKEEIYMSGMYPKPMAIRKSK